MKQVAGKYASQKAPLIHTFVFLRARSCALKLRKTKITARYALGHDGTVGGGSPAPRRVNALPPHTYRDAAATTSPPACPASSASHDGPLVAGNCSHSRANMKEVRSEWETLNFSQTTPAFKTATTYFGNAPVTNRARGSQRRSIILVTAANTSNFTEDPCPRPGTIRLVLLMRWQEQMKFSSKYRT